MSFKPKHLPYREALRVVAERAGTASGQTNPLLLALAEKAIIAEILQNGEWVQPTILPPIWFPHPYIGSHQEPGPGQIAHTHVRIAMDDIERLWPDKPIVNAVSNKGGRPGKHDWEGAMIEMARIVVLEVDEIISREALNKRIAQWFVDTHGDQPADSLIRDKVKRFHEAIWPPKT